MFNITNTQISSLIYLILKLTETICILLCRICNWSNVDYNILQLCYYQVTVLATSV